ncbi:hypothetical protein DNTS_026708 [Danionella cerebrum]|uniref:Uncharacterized protein n=1 Tax=Danionella cerebrum TaxID=2873325 RepID=A0A553RKY2_9TELE|nr:hypothetical protein DNTS_026708 [Danionella translucida]
MILVEDDIVLESADMFAPFSRSGNLKRELASIVSSSIQDESVRYKCTRARAKEAFKMCNAGSLLKLGSGRAQPRNSNCSSPKTAIKASFHSAQRSPYRDRFNFKVDDIWSVASPNERSFQHVMRPNYCNHDDQRECADEKSASQVKVWLRVFLRMTQKVASYLLHKDVRCTPPLPPSSPRRPLRTLSSRLIIRQAFASVNIQRCRLFHPFSKLLLKVADLNYVFIAAKSDFSYALRFPDWQQEMKKTAGVRDEEPPASDKRIKKSKNVRFNI